ncbi:MAG: hypothetical protein ACFBSC_21140, partial [Microcoleaceae cyanobacterium]
GKQERPILTKLFESGEAVTSVSHGVKGGIQPAQHILKHLRMHILKMGKPFFGLRQVFLPGVIDSDYFTDG